jgi:phosphotransacetylase
MNIPNVHSFDHLLHRARQLKRPPRTALVVPSAQEWLAAFDQAIREGIVEPTIIGDEELFNRHKAKFGLELPGAKIIDINQPAMAMMTAAQMAARDEIDLIVKGRGSTRDVLTLLLSKESGFVPRGKILSHIGVMKPEKYPKLLMISDAAVVPQPDLKTKIALVNNCRWFCEAIGIAKPRVAMLAAVEAIYPQMPVTTEAAVLAKMYERGQIKGVYLDGPLSFDCAIDSAAALSKGIKDSPVAGQVDVMIAPNLETANGVYKSMALYGRADVGGLLVGGRVPVTLGNKWDSMQTRFHGIVLGVLAASA